MGTILLIVLIILLLGGGWQRQSWGYGPMGIFGLLLLVLVICLVLRVIPIGF